MDAPISGFEATDTITIADASTIASALFTQTGAAGGTLALMDAARDVLGDLTLEGTYAPHQFAVASSSGAGGIVTNTITLTAPCFAAGTRVATPGGAVAVERLRVGEAVLTAAGAVRRIRWIGHRDVACRRHPEPALVLPVRIEAGAFAPGCPKRPLLLSPDHAVFVEAVLVPIKYLINGRSIRQVTVEEVGYWHVELDAHDILLAEGLPCESYLDTRNRSAFANGGIATQLHPDCAPGEEAHLFWEAAGCAPLRIDGAEVARVRAMLARRARRFGHDVVISKPVPCAAPRVVTDLAALLQPDRYRATYADVAMAGVDPRAHYAAHGRAEGRLPCSAADLLRGLGMVDPAMLPFGRGDLVDAGLDVAAHYVRAGWREQRRINPYFDAAWYCARNDVPDGVIPLLHYLLTGEAQGRAPGPHFDPAWYRATYAIAPTHSALAHYLAHRRTWRVSPNPRFDLASYIRALGGALLPGRDPYAHYRAFGQRAEVDDRWLAA